MAAGLPELIDPIAWAEAGRQMQGHLSVAAMPRLRDALHSEDAAGDLSVTLQGGVGDRGLRYLRGHVEGTLSAPCQRCLQPMSLAIDLDLALGLVHSAEDADRLPEPYEALVVTERTVAVASIVEDEVLMAVPIVAVHGTGECRPGEAAAGGAEEESGGVRPNPFAVLQRLKK